MKTAKLTFLTTFLLLCIFQNSAAQTTKGMWTAGGLFNYDQTLIYNNSTSTILIAPHLGYAFLDRWMVWGKISISLEDRYSRVGHELNLRYAFMKRPRLEGYVGLEYGLDEQRFLTNGGTNKIEQITIGPFAGYLHFFNPNIALDVAMHYPVYKNTSKSDYSNSGDVEIKLGLNFYFNSKLEKDSIPRKRALKKGQWMIGGAISFGGEKEIYSAAGNGRRFLLDNSYNRIMPYVGLLLSKRWMVGNRVSFYNTDQLVQLHFGMQPFGRYYFKSGKKSLFYGELNTLFHFRYINRKFFTEIDTFSPTERSIGMGIGMSRWILPNIVLDFYFGGKKGERKPSFTSIAPSNPLTDFQQFVFRIGLEFYL